MKIQKIIQSGNFGNNYEKKQNIHKDIFSIGKVFYELCFFKPPSFESKLENQKPIITLLHNGEDSYYNYSNELLNKVFTMLEVDENKRKSFFEVLYMFKKEYSKKCFRNESIYSVLQYLVFLIN